MAVVTSAVLAAGLATQAGVLAGASLGTSFLTAGLAGAAAGAYAGSQLNEKMFGNSGVEAPFKAVEDVFSPDMPEDPPAPDPVAKSSSAGAMMAEEKSLINRKGLQSTKKVGTVLQSQREVLGG